MIIVKFDIGDLYQNLLRKSILHQDRIKISGRLHEDLIMFCCRRHESIVVQHSIFLYCWQCS